MISRIEAACGLPDPAEACRVILALCREARGDIAATLAWHGHFDIHDPAEMERAAYGLRDALREVIS